MSEGEAVSRTSYKTEVSYHDQFSYRSTIEIRFRKSGKHLRFAVGLPAIAALRVPTAGGGPAFPAGAMKKAGLLARPETVLRFVKVELALRQFLAEGAAEADQAGAQQEQRCRLRNAAAATSHDVELVNGEVVAV